MPPYYRWVLSDALEWDKGLRPHLKGTNNSWRVDETDMQVQGAWQQLYQAVDAVGNTLDFLLSAKRDGKVTRCSRQVLQATHTQTSRGITVAKNAAAPVAVEALKADETLAAETA
jgi:transposase-like protein